MYKQRRTQNFFDQKILAYVRAIVQVVQKISSGGLSGQERGAGGGGELFASGIGEEDCPRRWRAHRHCTNGRALELAAKGNRTLVN